jgi:mitogen-activated protein kinase 1/3
MGPVRAPPRSGSDGCPIALQHGHPPLPRPQAARPAGSSTVPRPGEGWGAGAGVDTVMMERCSAPSQQGDGPAVMDLSDIQPQQLRRSVTMELTGQWGDAACAPDPGWESPSTPDDPGFLAWPGAPLPMGWVGAGAGGGPSLREMEASSTGCTSVDFFSEAYLGPAGATTAVAGDRDRDCMDYMVGSASPVAGGRKAPAAACTSSAAKGDDLFDDWEVGERYTLIRILGHGSYGEVAEAYDNVAQRRVAIKRILSIFDNETDARRICREIYILRQMHHPNCISLLDVVAPRDFQSFEDLYLIFEYVDTDMYKLILSPQFLSDIHIQTLLYQMLVALKYIHSANVIHRDMKPANILLNEDCSLKICDFGLSRVITPVPKAADPPSLLPGTRPVLGMRQMSVDAREEEERLCHKGAPAPGQGQGQGPDQRQGSPLNRQLTKHVVTRWYRPPELILLQDYSTPVDVWSCGCILAELLSMQAESVDSHQKRKPLFPGKSCFPLSADMPNCFQDKLDQLNMIFDVIGTPSEADTAKLGDVRKYLRRFPPKPAQPLRTLYPGADAVALDLLARMLNFDPLQRIGVDEALAHPYLQAVRDPAREVVAPQPIRDHLEARMNKDELKRLAWTEVMFYEHKSRSLAAAHRPLRRPRWFLEGVPLDGYQDDEDQEMDVLKTPDGASASSADGRALF